MKCFPGQNYLDEIELHMTQDMIDVTLEFQENTKNEYLRCQAEIDKLEKVDTSLPQTSVSGKPVVHWDRTVVTTMKEYWIVRRDAIKKFIDRDWIVEQGGDPHRYVIG